MGVTYLVIVESGANNYSAFVPDIPGCISTGKTVDETLSRMKEALEAHLAGMIEDGDRIPPPATQSIPLDPGETAHHIRIAITAAIIL